jgi:PAS domain S-box-containing protein
MECMVMSADDAIHLTTTDDGHPLDNEFIFVNPAFEKLTGYHLDEVVGKPVRILYGPKTDPQELERVCGSILENRHCRSEMVNYRKDGSEFWAELTTVPLLDEEGRRTHVLSIRHDITARKHAENELARLAGIVKCSYDGIISANVDGTLITWNEAAERLFGYSAREVLGRHAWLLEPPACHGEMRSLLEAMRRGEQIVERETLRLRKGGTEVPVALTIAPVKDADGTIVALSAIYHDITVRKRREKALRDSRQQLRSLAARSEAAREEERTRIARALHDELGQVLLTLALEIGNLLAPLQNSSSQAQSSLICTLIDNAMSSVHKMCSELRPSLLDNLGLRAAIEWQAQEFEKRTGITCRLDLDDVPLERDGSTIVFRVFQELLTNITRHAKATEVTVLLKQSRKHVLLQVSDNGCGLPEGCLADAKSLGIIGMRERAMVLGGTIRFVGVPQKGTTATLRIPKR